MGGVTSARNYFYVLWNGSQQLDPSFCCGRFENKAVITSKIEHHAVLYTVQALQNLIQGLRSSQAKWRNRYHGFSVIAQS
jgi:selenocysteine lyase/cysteine desulfurase